MNAQDQSLPHPRRLPAAGAQLGSSSHLLLSCGGPSVRVENRTRLPNRSRPSRQRKIGTTRKLWKSLSAARCRRWRSLRYHPSPGRSLSGQQLGTGEHEQHLRPPNRLVTQAGRSKSPLLPPRGPISCHTPHLPPSVKPTSCRNSLVCKSAPKAREACRWPMHTCCSILRLVVRRPSQVPYPPVRARESESGRFPTCQLQRATLLNGRPG